MRNALSLFGNDYWPSLADFDDIQREINRVFREFPTRSGVREVWALCDVEENENRYLLSFDMPGVAKDDIHIEWNDGRLIVSGERAETQSEENKTYVLSERYRGKFQRAFMLPQAVDADRVEASYKDGVLRLVIPKAESAKPRRIKISEGKSSVIGKLLGHDKEEAKQNEKEKKSKAAEQAA